MKTDPVKGVKKGLSSVSVKYDIDSDAQDDKPGSFSDSQDFPLHSRGVHHTLIIFYSILILLTFSLLAAGQIIIIFVSGVDTMSITEVDKSFFAYSAAFWILWFIVTAAILLLLHIFLIRPLRIFSDTIENVMNLDIKEANEVVNKYRRDRCLLGEISGVNQGIIHMIYSVEKFTQYVPKEVVRNLLSSSSTLSRGLTCTKNQGMSIREITVIFMDIANFTTICESIPPDDLYPMLESYFSKMSNILIQHACTIDKYIGDAIMGFWGAPLTHNYQSFSCCCATLHMQDSIINGSLAKMFRATGFPLHVRIGCHSGVANVGNVGCSARLSYTALGDTVNIASRLEGINKKFKTKIAVSDEIVSSPFTKNFVFRYLSKIALVGRNEAIGVYELVGIDPMVPTPVYNVGPISSNNKNKSSNHSTENQLEEHGSDSEGEVFDSMYSSVIVYSPNDSPRQLEASGKSNSDCGITENILTNNFQNHNSGVNSVVESNGVCDTNIVDDEDPIPYLVASPRENIPCIPCTVMETLSNTQTSVDILVAPSQTLLDEETEFEVQEENGKTSRYNSGINMNTNGMGILKKNSEKIEMCPLMLFDKANSKRRKSTNITSSNGGKEDIKKRRTSVISFVEANGEQINRSNISTNNIKSGEKSRNNSVDIPPDTSLFNVNYGNTLSIESSLQANNTSIGDAGQKISELENVKLSLKEVAQQRKLEKKIMVQQQNGDDSISSNTNPIEPGSTSYNRRLSSLSYISRNTISDDGDIPVQSDILIYDEKYSPLTPAEELGTVGAIHSILPRAVAVFKRHNEAFRIGELGQYREAADILGFILQDPFPTDTNVDMPFVDGSSNCNIFDVYGMDSRHIMQRASQFCSYAATPPKVLPDFVMHCDSK
eukprot:Tbor_TRINITY_DN6098_c2_g5::TRINITY_DN6098_c2_g5_i1::g.10407::m.10407/K01768/E4.6.1.1; adenylate cyclase